ncbi:bud site selection protein [Sorochytrium milnesiophthora]
MASTATPMAALKDVCELFENVLGEALVARTENLHSFRLGPPDLCHIVKTSPKLAQDVTSYHHVSGVDASSPGALAAYINTLTYSVETQKGWFSSSQPYKIKSGVYCCYNAFSMLDVRVEVRIPGGVSLYAVSRQGKRVAVENASAMFWHELFVSSMLRAMLDTEYPPSPAALRKLDPLPNVNIETRFLDSVREVFMKGWQLGCEPDVQVPTNVSNVLVYGLTKYFGTDAGRWDVLEKLWTDLLPKDPHMAALLAQAHMGMDQDSKAVKVLFGALQKTPMSSPLLLAQVEFLQKKDKSEYALMTAKRLVNSAPLEFKAWAKLTECYMHDNDWQMALLTLNSCPMFTVPARDQYPLPPPVKAHFPALEDIDFAEYSDNDTLPLAPLRAENLKGTFRRAYMLLAQMVNGAGWEELLQHRAKVFIMEDEYRQVKEKELQGGEDEQLLQQEEAEQPSEEKGDPSDSPNGAAAAEEAQSDGHQQADADAVNDVTVTDNEGGEPKRENDLPQADHHDHHTPQLAKTSATTQSTSRLITAFSHKRLCERWLDDLFLMLYEDLRVYTAWKAEETHSKTYSLAYRRTPGEWEYLGNLCLRLSKQEDARNAYKQAADARFSPKSLLQLLQLSSEDGEINETLRVASKLVSIPGGSISLLYRVYGDITVPSAFRSDGTGYADNIHKLVQYPNPIASAMFRLIRRYGLAKVQSSLVALNLSPKLFKHLTRYLEYAETFKVSGWDS